MVKVEKYLIPDTESVNVDYNMFANTPTMPVVYNNKPYSSYERQWAELPTKIVFPYLRELYSIRKNVVLGERARTIKIIHLEHDKKLYLIPNLSQIDQPKLECDGGPFALFTNPEINKMIVEQIKPYRFR